MSTGRQVPSVTSVLTDEAIAFAVAVIDSSGVPQYLESFLVRRTGRRRTISVRALLVALYLLASDGRALHLKSATRLLFVRLPPHWRKALSVTGEATTPTLGASMWGGVGIQSGGSVTVTAGRNGAGGLDITI